MKAISAIKKKMTVKTKSAGVPELMHRLRTAMKVGANRRMNANKAREAALDPSAFSESGYIEDQSALKSVRYGCTDLAWAGCGIAAAYNALVALREIENAKRSEAGQKLLKGRISLSKLVRAFEKHGAVFFGMLGTDPASIAAFFKRDGFKTEASAVEERVGRIAASHDVLIITYMHDCDDITRQVHTVTAVRETDGSGKRIFRVHNSQGSGHPSISGDTLGLFAENAGERAKIVYVCGITGWPVKR